MTVLLVGSRMLAWPRLWLWRRRDPVLACVAGCLCAGFQGSMSKVGMVGEVGKSGPRRRNCLDGVRYLALHLPYPST